MNPSIVVAAVLGLVALATVAGVVGRARAGRVRRAPRGAVIRVGELPGVVGLGSDATLVQFSTEFCSPCRAAHRVLDDVARERDGVAHVDVGLTDSPELAGRFNILQTPTTLILDRRGVVQARIGGAPRPLELRAELDRVLALA